MLLLLMLLLLLAAAQRYNSHYNQQSAHLPAAHCLLWPVEPVDLQLHILLLLCLDNVHNLANLQQVAVKQSTKPFTFRV
jgi:hypothetical protein